MNHKHTTRPKARAASRKIYSFDLGRLSLVDDNERRLRNAKNALQTLDPNCQAWIKKNLKKSLTISQQVRIIEIQARTLLMGKFKSTMPTSRIEQIIKSDLPFTDDGHLWAR